MKFGSINHIILFGGSRSCAELSLYLEKHVDYQLDVFTCERQLNEKIYPSGKILRDFFSENSIPFASTEDINVVTGKLYAINDKKALSSTQLYVNCSSADAAATIADNNGALYLNTAIPGTSANDQWRIKVDNNGDVVFQKRVGGAFQNKFRIQ